VASKRRFGELAGGATWKGVSVVGLVRERFGSYGHDRTSRADLAQSYERCRLIHQARGRSYYRATALLPADRRRAVHALYAFTRLADDIVDGGLPADLATERLTAWRCALVDALHGRPTTDPVLPAVAETVRSYGLDLGEIDQFLASMAMDLTITRYRTYPDLLGYMEGSSAVIGTLMLPILGLAPGSDVVAARTAARELGYGFQLTNFIRDVAEDLDRGRIYLPLEDLAKFGVTPVMLAADTAGRRASEPVRELVRYECGRALAHYTAARAGIDLLQPRARICIRAAYLLYGSILGEVARAGYDVLRERVVVPEPRRARLVLAALHPRTFTSTVARWSYA
jgi:phytoene synthase